MIMLRIDEDGNLHVNRAGEMKGAKCPRITPRPPCGDECALFRCPYPLIQDGPVRNYNEILIKLCEAIHFCKADEFEDMRAIAPVI